MLLVGERLLAGRGADRDAKAGRRWIERAGEGGHLPALHRLADLTLEGDEADPNAAAAWLRRAVESDAVAAT